MQYRHNLYFLFEHKTQNEEAVKTEEKRDTSGVKSRDTVCKFIFSHDKRCAEPVRK